MMMMGSSSPVKNEREEYTDNGLSPVKLSALENNDSFGKTIMMRMGMTMRKTMKMKMKMMGMIVKKEWDLIVIVVVVNVDIVLMVRAAMVTLLISRVYK